MLPSHAQKNPSARAAAFDYQGEKRALEAQAQRLMLSIAETAAATSAHDFLPRPEYPPLPPFQWRDANWTLIGGLLFGVIFWWAIFTFVFSAPVSA